jgi:MFS family permease
LSLSRVAFRGAAKGDNMRPLSGLRTLYYGWVLVFTLALTETTSWGILYYAFTVFLTPMQAELGWSRADLTGAFSVALLLSGLAGIPVGRWLDRHGPRLLMTLGSCVASLLVLAWAKVERLTTFTSSGQALV